MADQPWAWAAVGSGKAAVNHSRTAAENRSITMPAAYERGVTELPGRGTRRRRLAVPITSSVRDASLSDVFGTEARKHRSGADSHRATAVTSGTNKTLAFRISPAVRSWSKRNIVVSERNLADGRRHDLPPPMGDPRRALREPAGD